MLEQFLKKNWTVLNRIIIILLYVMTFSVIATSLHHGFTITNTFYMSNEVLDLFSLILLLIIVSAIMNNEGAGFVEIKLYKQEKYYIIEIKDNGVGFDINNPKDDGRSHIGLGNTTRRIRMVLHGDIKVKSTLGEGTCIQIKVPKK